jgi:carbon monoxide dehydrogenase subunit G
MKMSGEERINAPREKVWAALNDPAILKKSITGCKSLDKTSDTEFSATVQAKVGPVKATFNGDVKLSKLKPPQSYVLSGQGKGGVAGFAKGKATVKLAQDGDATILTYDVDAQVGGKLAQIGSRLISSTAKKMANDFFKKFARLAAQPDNPTSGKKATTKKVASKKSPAKPVKKAAKKTTGKPTAQAKAPAKPAPAKEAASNAATTNVAVDSAPSKSSKTTVQTHVPTPSQKRSPVFPIVMSLIGAAILVAFYFYTKQN